MVVKGPICKALRFLTKDELVQIHQATLEVLEHTGMRSDSENILGIFRNAGAEVDLKNRRIKIPQHLIDEALEKTPRQYVLCGRNSKYDILLHSGRVYFGMGGTPVPFIRDIETGEFRRPTKRDMSDATRLGDALPNMSFLMNIAGAFDVPYEAEYIHEFEVLFNNTEKPILYSAPSGEETKFAAAMASAIVGGPEELKKRPILSIYCETTSPLMFSASNDNMIECAKAGIPVTLGPAPMRGGSAPITLAGAAVVSNSESLAAITLMQLVKPGTPVNYACWGVSLDPRTGVASYATPENALSFGVINGQLADYYDLPSFGLGGAIDSKVPDAQAGSEMTLVAMANALSGVSLIHDHGYLASGSAGSMEMAVICNEVVGYIRRVIEGIRIDSESLATDVIRSVGPGGQFFSQKHTLKLLEREIYIPELFDKRSIDAWVKDGRKDVTKVANTRVKRILEEHHPEPLPQDVKQKIADIVKAAEGRLVRKTA
jgi:trimethylamine--corrinoid protein Co-methyltransferase